MHTRHPGLAASWKAHLDDRHYARVFVWRALIPANEFLAGVSGMARPALRVVRCDEDGEAGEVCIPRKFAEVHLWEGKYDAEVVAHELMHVMCFWVEARGLDVVEDNEAIAEAAGRLAAGFWSGHYEAMEAKGDGEAGLSE